MKITFKTFLIEGGAATAKFNVGRATKQDIVKALDIVSKTLGLDRAMLQSNLLGSTEATLAGKKKDSGDIDIALTTADIDMDKAHAAMMQLTNNEGSMNKGTKIGSYAVDVGGKKVQVDLMFVNSREWAKFIYHSAQGRGSKYPGVIRNMLLMATVRYTHQPGKDMLVKKDGQVIARASRAVKLDAGVERLFKRAKFNEKKGKYSTTMDKVEPAELQQHVDQLVGRPVKFSHDPDILTNPDKVAQFAFGRGVRAADIMTAEQVIERIKQLKNTDEIFKAAREDFKNAGLEAPKEMP